MSIPKIGDSGDLPPGVYQATLSEVLKRFGTGTMQRQVVAQRLARIHELVCSTGHLKRFVVFGSFVTAKPEPNDVDVVIVMDDDFVPAKLHGDAALVFDHLAASVVFGASIFWTRSAGALGGEQAMVEYWQVRRDGGMRGIIEIS